MLRLVAAGATLAAALAGSAGGCLGPDRDDRPRHERRADVRDCFRQRQPERDGHDLVRRVRDDNGLRLEDVVRERRLRLEQRRGLARTVESQAGHHVPLPRRRDVERRDRPRRRRPADDPVRAGGRHRAGKRHHGVGGDAPRHRQPEHPRDLLVLRVRDEHELRHEDRRPRTQARARAASTSPHRSRASRPAGRITTASSRRATPGTSRGADKTFLTAAAPTVATKAASSHPRHECDAERHRQPERPVDVRVLRVWHDDGYGSKTPAEERRRRARARPTCRSR